MVDVWTLRVVGFIPVSWCSKAQTFHQYTMVCWFSENTLYTRAPPEIFPGGGGNRHFWLFLAGQGGGQLEFFGGLNGQNERISPARGGHGPPLPMPGGALDCTYMYTAGVVNYTVQWQLLSIYDVSCIIVDNVRGDVCWWWKQNNVAIRFVWRLHVR